MDAVGSDVQILSPRPFMMVHGSARWDDNVAWTQTNNDLIARTIKLYPKRFRGVGGLPQALGRPVETLFDEITRCVEELGFVGVLLNPDPGEGIAESPPLGDPYWYPLYERLCRLDLPAHIHSCGSCGRETYDEHFVTEESLAITSIARSAVFQRFPTLKLLVSHGGGSIPYQVGRWRSNRQMAIEGGRLPKDTESFDETLRRFWFDTVLHHKKSLELLFDVVGTDRCCFGTERPGSGGGIDPQTGRPFDDLKPVIESIEMSAAARAAIFAGNARRLFSRLDL
jgi:4-oxalmesaconate hydratase